MAKSPKTTKATEAKTTKATGAKAAPSKTKTTTAKSNSKATGKTAAGNPAAKLAKTCQEAAAKFEKMNDQKYTNIKEKLEWCIGSYNHDKNPAGLKEYGQQAVGLLKEAKKDKPRLVTQKLIDDLEKSLASI